MLLEGVCAQNKRVEEGVLRFQVLQVGQPLAGKLSVDTIDVVGDVFQVALRQVF
jgi:hypothetical protein